MKFSFPTAVTLDQKDMILTASLGRTVQNWYSELLSSIKKVILV